MSTATRPSTIGPADHGRAMSYDDFIAAERAEGWLYELSRGIVDVTEVPGLPHGMIVDRVTTLFVMYRASHPGIIHYRAGGGECRIRLPWMASDRHPDQAVYLIRDPKGPGLWARWVPAIVVEVLSKRGEHRDFVLKREEYRQMGVSEYWILDRYAHAMHVDRKVGDAWEELILGTDAIHRTDLLPGLEVRVGELLGEDETDDDGE